MSREILEKALIALKTCDEYEFAGQVYMQFSKDTVDDSIEEIEATLAESEQCTNSDTWNCKYCKKTKDCPALADKRNLAEPEQEPVATVNVWYDDGLPCFNTCWTASPINWSVGTYYLYGKPPRQEPVYLCDDEIKSLVDNQIAAYGQLCDSSDFEIFASAVIAAYEAKQK